jgi:hypothetical protein
MDFTMTPVCEFYKVCPFFTDSLVAGMPSTAKLLKEKYCSDAYSKCARYRVTLDAGEQYVEDSLFPNHEDKGLAIIARVKGESDR